MRLIDFISSLLPRFSKDTILEDIRISKSELQTGVITSFDQAAKFFVESKPVSKEFGELSTLFYRNYESPASKKQPNLISEIDTRLGDVLANLVYAEGQLEDVLESDVITDGLTAKKAVLIRTAEHIAFISKFSIDLLNYVYAIEANSRTKDTPAELAKAQVDFIWKNVANYARAMSVYGRPEKEFKKQLEETPEVVINGKTAAALAAVYTDKKLDPCSMQMLEGFNGSPIYHFRMVYAEWQANRYKSHKEKKRMLELRLLNLKLIQEKNNDPKLEREIEYIQNRIEGIEYKMAKMEQ